MKQAIVIALGGSLLSNKTGAELTSWKLKIVELVISLNDEGKKVIIIIGGGELARKKIKDAIDLGLTDEHELDLIGIESTRINAMNFLKLFSNTNVKFNQEIPQSIEKGVSFFMDLDLIVMGGTVPGQTTDTVAIKFGEEIGAERVIVATNVSHVFTDDPRKNPTAEKIKSMSLNELGILSGVGAPIKPGSSFAVDPIGVGVAMSANLPLVILNGDDVANLRKAINGETFEGTNVYGVN